MGAQMARKVYTLEQIINKLRRHLYRLKTIDKIRAILPSSGALGTWDDILYQQLEE